LCHVGYLNICNYTFIMANLHLKECNFKGNTGHALVRTSIELFFLKAQQD